MKSYEKDKYGKENEVNEWKGDRRRRGKRQEEQGEGKKIKK